MYGVFKYAQYSKIIDFAALPDPTDIWDVGETIGEGTYGEVFSAVNKQSGQCAAIKCLESVHEYVEEIEEEYQILRDLSWHRNLPEFFGLFLKHGPHDSTEMWIAMELCGAGSVTDLSKHLKKQGGRLPEILIAHILKEAMKALQHLHSNHVMHRDVKGHNILMTSDAQVKLIDFGVSGHLDSTMDRRKTSVGTPFWMAPEVIACDQQLDYNYDNRCDIWSLGITAIEIADGIPPLSTDHPSRALFKIPRNPPPQVEDPSNWSPDFNDFIASCLVKDFEVRPFISDLFQHPFIQQVPDDVSQIQSQLQKYISQMERHVHEPDITTKRGRLKTHRKSRRDFIPTEDDLALLESLDEATIVSQLFNRYMQSQIYTFIGDILLAVNPFTPMTIYSDEYSRMYMNAAKRDNPPHIYAVADQAYQMMTHNMHNQCIVISGESGAGKTESANFLVQQLTQLGKAPNRTLEDRILQVNPLMEAFGNAKTVINDNSSRFGKYLEMIFTTHGKVTGAKITEYLLEKSRVISQGKGEQNFHIFYYVYDGLTADDKRNVYLMKDKQAYRYIADYTSGPNDIGTMSINRVRFKAIQHCFDIIGFSRQEVDNVYAILVAILQMGNIEFLEQEMKHAENCSVVANEDLLNIAAKLLGIDAKEMSEALTTTAVVARGEIMIRSNSISEAADARDAMAKALYGRLFSWIVNQITRLLKPRADNDGDGLAISLLDIFGFENFQQNSFEQLCINIANEQIQYYFNQHIFAWEMQEYKNEGIDATEISFIDNRPILDMFLMKASGHQVGLLALLDEESHFPQATDQTLVEKLNLNIHSPHYSHPKANNLTFCIDHYAGKVDYNVTGFLEKNRDRLSVDVINMLRNAQNLVARTLFQTPLTKTGNLAYSSARSSHITSSLSSPASTLGTVNFTIRSASGTTSGSKNSVSASMTRIQQTVATYFRYSLMDLLSKMVAGSPHFVRCIKPNDNKEPGNYHSQKVTVQLRYTGVLETTRIRRLGYSHRLTFSECIKRYHMLGFNWNDHYGMDRQSCGKLLQRIGLENWALGKSKVFLKYYHVEQLARKFEEYNRKIVIAQSCVRMWLARSRFDKMKWKMQMAALQIQKVTRGWLVRKRVRGLIYERRHAVIKLQKFFRGFLTRKQYQPIIIKRREAAIRIQALVRGRQQRRLHQQVWLKEHQAAIVIQRAYRGQRARYILRQLREDKNLRRTTAAKVIQTYFCMWKCMSIYHQLLEYKTQKELQFIYFGQQVELYNNDLFQTMMKNNNSPIAKTKPLQIPEIVNVPPTPIKSPIINRRPDVSEERWQHMLRMNETKSLMPDSDQSCYYNVVTKSEQRTDSLSRAREKKQLMPEGHEEYYGSLNKNKNVTVIKNDPDNQSLNWDEPLRQARAKIMGVSDDGLDAEFLSPAEMDDISRSMLAQSVAQAIIANKPVAPKELYLPIMPKSESFSSLPWDAPLQSARNQALASDASPTAVNGGHFSGLRHIDEDPQTDREELLYNSEDKYEFTKRLEQEAVGSILALWRPLDNQASASGLAHHNRENAKVSNYNHAHLDSRNSNKNIPSNLNLDVTALKIQNANLKSTLINVRFSTPKHYAINNNEDEDEDTVKFNFRSHLRKTNIDLKNTLKAGKDISPEQVDFRHVLKRRALDGKIFLD